MIIVICNKIVMLVALLHWIWLVDVSVFFLISDIMIEFWFLGIFLCKIFNEYFKNIKMNGKKDLVTALDRIN